MEADGASSGSDPHVPQDTAEVWGRVTSLDGAPICEGRLTFRAKDRVLVHISTWFERRISEPRGLLHCLKVTHSVEMLYYTESLLAAAICPLDRPDV